MDDLFAKLKLSFQLGKSQPLAHRRKELNGLRSFLSDYENEICEALQKDLRKPRFESLTSEIGVLRVEITHTLANLNRWTKPKRVWTPLAQLWSSCSYTFEPKGLVLTIGPWNFPLQLVLAPLIGAIAAGNTVILKPSEFAPHVSRLLFTELPKYLDQDCVQVIEGDHLTSQSLLQMKFDHIFFTGSTDVGRIVMQEAARNLVPVTLELGGKSPCIVDQNADLALSAKRIIWGKLLNCGQVCLAPDYVLVHESIAQPFINAASEAIAHAYSTHPEQSQDFGRIVSKKHTLRLQSLLVNQNVVFGGEVDIEHNYVAPTIVLNPKLESQIMKEEIFGPILPVITFNDLEDARAIVNQQSKPLAIYFFSNDMQRAADFRSKTTSGAFLVNDTVSHVAVSDLPFGGVGGSGMGTYHGEDSFQAFSYKRAYMKKSTLIDMPMRYAPYSKLNERLAGWFMR